MIINSVSYQIKIGIISSPDPFADTTQYRTFIDGAISSLNYGSRVARTANIIFEKLEKTVFYTLVDFLSSNSGTPISFTYENEAEQLWFDVTGTPVTDGNEYFVYILEPGGFQEEDFSITDELYTVTLKVSLAGITSTSIPNEDSSSLIDALISIDTTAGATKTSAEPVNPSVGDRWMPVGNSPGADDIVVDDLGEWNGTKWIKLYSVYPDDSDYGWFRGTFYFAAFSDTTVDDILYKAGIINHKAIRFPGQSIDVSNGPATSRREGFKFSIKNNDDNERTFWNFVVINKVNLFGSIGTISIYQSSAITQLTTFVTGRNTTNSFNYTNYTFNFEPFSLTSQKKIPDTTIKESNSRYDGVRQGIIGKAPYLTYGTHQIASLQDISTDPVQVTVSRTLAPPDTTTLDTSTFQGRIKFIENLSLSNISFVSTGIADYTISGASSLIADAVAGDEIKISGNTNANHNGDILTVISVSGQVLRVSNPNVNTASIDDPSPSGIITWLTEKIYVRKTTDTKITGFKAFDQHTLDDALVTKLNLGTSVLTVNFDSQFATSTDNYNSIKKIISIDDAVTNSDYYILTLDSLLPLPSTIDPNAGTADTLPRTRDYIFFIISSFAFQYQSGDVPHQSFGVYNDNNTPKVTTDFTFDEDAIKIFALDDKGKALNAIPNTKFTINDDNNLIVLNPESAAGSTTVETHKPLEEFPLIIQTNGGIVESLPVTTSSKDTIDQEVFDFSGVTSLPTNFTYWALARRNLTGSTIQPYVFHAALDSAETIYKGGSVNRVFPTRSGDDFLTLNNLIITQTESQSGASTNGVFEDGSTLMAIQFPINHSQDDDFVNNTSVKLVMKFDFISKFQLSNTLNTGIATRSHAQSFTLYIRFRAKDGTYLYTDTQWKYEFGRLNLGVTHNNTGTEGLTGFDNIPVGTSDKFSEDTDILEDQELFAIITYPTPTSQAQVSGDIRWNNSIKATQTWNGSSWASTNPIGDTDNDGKLIYFPLGNDEEGELGDAKVYVIRNGAIEEATVETDFTLSPKMSGRDLIDLTGDTINLFNGSGFWESLDAMELIFEVKWSETVYPLSLVIGGGAQHRAIWDTSLTFPDESPKLYIIETQDVTDKPLFSAVKGKLIDSVFTESAKDITEDILQTIYPDQFETTSLDTFFEGSRSEWKFRRQFTSAMSAKSALDELLWNLFAVAIINKDDKFEIKALNTSSISSSSSLVLTDVNIIQDSISEIKYRKADKIYQFFKLGYDYNIPSEFSNAFWDYGKQITVNEDEGPIELQVLINNSGILYNLENFIEKNFKYHYESLPIAEDVIKWLAFNSWTFKCKVAIETILEPDPVKLFSSVTFTSYFHSTSVTYKGYIVAIQPDIYSGTAALGIYIPEPAGVNGPLCDLFNDALNITERDITGWTNTNGQRNNAGQISSRTLSELTEKEANQISTREFEC